MQQTDLSPVVKRILDAASQVFREKGYQASLATIARCAKVARQTLYNHFPNKEEIFAAVMRYNSTVLLDKSLTSAVPLRQCLLDFGLYLRRCVLDEQNLANFRVLLAHSIAHPEVARAYFDNGPEIGVRRLAEYFRIAMQRGQLREDVPQFVAEMFIGMLMNVERLRGLIGHSTKLSQNVEQRRVTHIVDCFLTAFAVEPLPQ